MKFVLKIFEIEFENSGEESDESRKYASDERPTDILPPMWATHTNGLESFIL